MTTALTTTTKTAKLLTAMASKDLLIIAINILRRTIIDETHHSANREVPTVEVKAAWKRKNGLNRIQRLYQRTYNT